MEQEEIARVCHEVNRGLCEALGDNSQPRWEDAPEWQRSSALNGVKSAIEYNFGPSRSHESWMDEKIADGWVRGDVKDPEAKTHPCLVSFFDLPPEQRLKDHLFVKVVEILSQQ